MDKVIAIDPGKSKCGFILADIDTYSVNEASVVESSKMFDLLVLIQNKYIISNVFLGNGTTSKYWEKAFSHSFDFSINLIEEKGTTLRARDRYWEIWPPNKLYKLIPRGLILPSKQLDPIAALILLEDYFDKKFLWPINVSIKTWP